MKKNFLSMMKHSMMAICTVAAMGMITASLAACSTAAKTRARRMRQR